MGWHPLPVLSTVEVLQSAVHHASSGHDAVHPSQSVFSNLADKDKKQIPLRVSAKLYDAIAAWAEDDFRSINGQIEYLLTECVRQRKKNGKYVGEEIDVPPELDIS